MFTNCAKVLKPNCKIFIVPLRISRKILTEKIKMLCYKSFTFGQNFNLNKMQCFVLFKKIKKKMF